MFEVLEDQLMPDFSNAKSVFIATALLSLQILNRVTERLSAHTKVHWLVGIDLPTNPEVFENLMNKDRSSEQIYCKVYLSKEVFHPKVYIIGLADGTYSGYVGSANATAGGFKNNVEMTLRTVDNTECENLISWYKRNFDKGSEINQDFLYRYRIYFKRVRARNASNKSDAYQLKKLFCPRDANESRPALDSYFQNVDFAAFGPEREKDRSLLAASERKNVWSKLGNIHRNIYPQFGQYGLEELKCHHDKGKIVSAHYHSPFSRERKDAVWLNYGYSAIELNGSKLMDHPRVQVILRSDKIGLWLVIGKNNGSVPERERFRSRIETDEIFLTLFFKEVQNLGGAYELEINDDYVSHKLQINNLNSETQLKNFILLDERKFYFTIRRTF